jgi:hypothetical protein
MTPIEATAGRDNSQASDTWYGCKPHSWLSRLDSTADLQLGVGEHGATESLVTGELPFLDVHAGQQPAVQRAERHDGQRRFRLAQWTGTATSSTASASGTTIGFGRR